MKRSDRKDHMQIFKIQLHLIICIKRVSWSYFALLEMGNEKQPQLAVYGHGHGHGHGGLLLS